MSSSNKTKKENSLSRLFNNHYAVAFFSTLVVSIGLIIYGVLTPPKGEVSGSLITSCGVLFLWPTLAFANKALDEGKTAKLKHNDTELVIEGKKKED